MYFFNQPATNAGGAEPLGEREIHPRQAPCLPPGARAWRNGVAAGALLLVAALAAGCNPGVRWELSPFPDAHAMARDAHQLTFVYFRNWYVRQCTDFEELVLKDPEVLAQLRNMVCVPLDFDWDRVLARQWGLSAAPAFVIVTPTSDVVARGQGLITREQLLDAVRGASEKFARNADSSPRPPAVQP